MLVCRFPCTHKHTHNTDNSNEEKKTTANTSVPQFLIQRRRYRENAAANK